MSVTCHTVKCALVSLHRLTKGDQLTAILGHRVRTDKYLCLCLSCWTGGHQLAGSGHVGLLADWLHQAGFPDSQLANSDVTLV